MDTTWRRIFVLLVSACLLALGLVGIAVPASAQPAPVGPWGDFYDPPVPLAPGRPGDIIRTQPSYGLAPATATRILYRSEDTHDGPIAISGTYFAPGMPWRGTGPRPLVSVAGGTQGFGRQCAPSMMFNTLLEYHPPFDLMADYELPFIDLLLAQGVAVVFTDYSGLGTPGPHPYVNRKANGRAVLDAARAAVRLPNSGLQPDSPVGLWGYSEGGGATAAAAELQPTYAPELNLKGTYSGAPPANLATTLSVADGSLFVGAIGYALNGFAGWYPQMGPIIDTYMNDRGRQMLAATATQCDLETMQYAFTRTNAWTKTGQSLAEIIAQEPAAQAIIAEQFIGNVKPTAPVLVVSNVNDDLVPNGQVRRLVADWCGKGATVTYSQINLPPILPGTVAGHGLPLLPAVAQADQWLLDRFNGVPAPSSC